MSCLPELWRHCGLCTDATLRSLLINREEAVPDKRVAACGIKLRYIQRRCDVMRFAWLRQAIAMQIKPMFCAPGEHVMHRGDAIHHIYYVCAGSLEILNSHGMVVAILGERRGGEGVGGLGHQWAQPAGRVLLFRYWQL